MSSILPQKFFFIRHAETDWNQRKLCQGQTDIALNQKGKNDAKKIALESLRVPFECIVSSPLSRAFSTAQEIHYLHPKASLYTALELSERCWGSLEGMSSKDMYAIEKLEEDNASYSPGKGVEERYEFRKRVEQGLCLAQSYHKNPLIVSHGRVFMEICFLLGIPLVRQIPNCQLIGVVPLLTQHDCSWSLQTLVF